MKKYYYGVVALLLGMATFIQAEVVVNLDFISGAGTTDLTPARTIDVSTSNEATYAWSDSALLFDGDNAKNQDVYGAFTATGAGVISGADLEVQDSGPTDDNDYLRFDALKSASGDQESRILALWDSGDFLASGFNSFDASTNSALTLGINTFANAGVHGARFVIRDGSQFYVSSFSTTVSASINGATAGLEWGAFDVNNWASYTNNAADLGMGVTTFSSMTFTNVTGVGFLSDISRPNTAGTALRISDFQADLVGDITPPPTNNNPLAIVVDLDFISGAGTTDLTPARAIDVSTSNEATYAWSDSVLLFDGDETKNQDVYGAFTATGAGIISGADLEVQDSGPADTADFLRFDALKSASGDQESRILALWDSSGFLTNGYTIFDTTLNSSLTLGITTYANSGGRGARFVIRDGSQFYVSSVDQQATGQVLGSGVEWGSFDVNDWVSFTNGATDLGMGVTNFSSMTFSNVTGVGFIADIERPNDFGTAFRINDFQAQLVSDVAAPPTNNYPLAVVVDLDKTGFGTQSPDRSPDVDDTATVQSEITYSFSTNNSLFTEPGPNATPIYGGFTVTGPAGTVSNAAVTLNTNDTGFIELTGLRVGGASGTMDSRAMLFWDSSDFLQSGYSMLTDSGESYIQIDIHKLFNPGALNVVIRDGNIWYLSDSSETVPGTLTVNGLNTLWAEFDPADFALFDSDIAPGFGVTTNVYAARVFTNITAVGLIAHVDRGGTDFGPVLNISDVIVKLEGDGVVPYQEWASLWLPADVSDPSADFDGDKLSNLGEYALNGNPTNAADKGLTEVSSDGQFFKVVHAKHATDSSLVYRLLDTTNLVSGASTTNGYVSQFEGPAVGDYKMVTNNYGLAQDQLFIELEIEQP
jgi:hypothetical protein